MSRTNHILSTLSNFRRAFCNVPSPVPVDLAATYGIIFEASAPKPGNVHPAARFDDLTFADFLKSATVVAPIIARTHELGVGRAVLDAVKATREAVGTNTNLGTLLLLAPLANVPDEVPHAIGIESVLQQLTFDDTRNVYEAIRISAAGGLGKAEEADVASNPPPNLSLVDAMRMASERDLVARQYGNLFADVFRIAEWIEQGIARGWTRDTAMVHAHIRQLATEADSLIVRKCGPAIGEESRTMAKQVLESGAPGDNSYDRTLTQFDAWLRADGHRRNPGTTADLIAAALFVLLREGRLKFDLRV